MLYVAKRSINHPIKYSVTLSINGQHIYLYDRIKNPATLLCIVDLDEIDACALTLSGAQLITVTEVTNYCAFVSDFDLVVELYKNSF